MAYRVNHVLFPITAISPSNPPCLFVHLLSARGGLWIDYVDFFPLILIRGRTWQKTKKMEKSDDHINFFTSLPVHCCSLLNISMSLLSTKWSRLSENEPVYPTFLLIQRSIFTIFPSVGAAMGFWERGMHISERSWQSTNTFIPALDDNSHQTLPLGTQIIPLLFRWSPRWYNCSKNTV